MSECSNLLLIEYGLTEKIIKDNAPNAEEQFNTFIEMLSPRIYTPPIK